jgi:hypothetical protein
VNKKCFPPQDPKATKTKYLPERFFASFRFFAVGFFFRLLQLPDSTPARRESLLIAFPRIRGPCHPAGKPIRFAIADARGTRKSLVILFNRQGVVEHYSLTCSKIYKHYGLFN